MNWTTRRALPLLALASACAHAVSAAPVPGFVFRGTDGPMFKLPDGRGTVRLLLNATNGSREGAVDVLTLSPGSVVADHGHDGSAEIIYIEAGAMEVTIGGARLAAGAGDA